MRIIDISVTLRDGLAAWPGEDSWRIEAVHRMAQGGPANVSRITMGVHTGTHVDAPWHFGEGMRTVEALPLECLVTRARVIDLTRVERAIHRRDLEPHLADTTAIVCKTRNSGSLERLEPFNPDFIHLDASAADCLVERGVRTVGVDYLSVEGFHVPNAPVHHRLLGADVCIIEGLDLSHAAPGDYLLVVLPLKLAGADGAPARAVLIDGV
jgi:arylformamidase